MTKEEAQVIIDKYNLHPSNLQFLMNVGGYEAETKKKMIRNNAILKIMGITSYTSGQADSFLRILEALDLITFEDENKERTPLALFCDDGSAVFVKWSQVIKTLDNCGYDVVKRD